MTAYLMTGCSWLLPLLALWILARCVRSMLRGKYEPETWACLVNTDKKVIPINHWECIIGRSASADITVPSERARKVHASLQRSDEGIWSVTPVGGGDTQVNGQQAGRNTPVADRDRLTFGDRSYTFRDVGEEARLKLEARRSAPGRFVGPGVTLLALTLFQAVLALEYSVTASTEYLLQIELAFLALCALEWICYLLTRSARRTGFEPETLAFFLTTLGVSVVATGTPDEMFKELMLIIAAVAAFFILGIWLRDMGRVRFMRWVAAAAAVGLLGLNLVSGTEVLGARNWLTIAGVSLQPSELVKVAYIFTGAATLDRLFARRNLLVFIGFSAACVGALALMGDFGAAFIFFATFLVISFMRSGSFATVLLAVAGAGMAGFLVFTVKPYIAQRFASWGHVWADVWDKGYQQTRTLSAAASGGMLGKGAGAGWLQDVVFSNTDMVFGIVCEELGLIVGVCAIFALIALALFAVRNAARGRSTYYVIAGCAAASMMLVQMSLNVFGSLDILPFTGVTFPFVSKGGTSLISCWMLLAFVKAADTRKDASFVVRAPARRHIPSGAEEDAT